MIHKSIKSKLMSIYAKIPNIECKKLCYEACALIGVEEIEHQLIVERLNFDPFTRVVDKDLMGQDYGRYCSKFNENNVKCPMLNASNECSIYDIRPWLCRAYGVVKRMQCPHGCKPERFISDIELARLTIEIQQLEKEINK